MNFLDFNKNQEAIILLVVTFQIVILFFQYDKIDRSNLLTMFFELSVAGFIGFILARYYFNKDRQLQRREKDEKQKKLKNDFEHRLRKSHSQIWVEVNRPDGKVPSFSLIRIDSLLSETILSFKNFNRTDIDSERNIHNASMLIKKHIENDMDDSTKQMDLRLALNLLEKVGEVYHIDLTPA